MDALHWALVALVVAWTLISLVLGTLVAFLVQKVRAQLRRVDEILQVGHGMAEDVRAPIHAVAQSVREVFGTPPRRQPEPPRDELPGEPAPV
jgi:hypothetical protein